MTETATFGAGCFWGVEVDFRNTPGVKDAAVGYMGGDVPNPTYEQVCTDRTGHAEVVQVEFDPDEVSYDTLCGRSGTRTTRPSATARAPTWGAQYRSAIFYHSPEQQEIALASKARSRRATRCRSPPRSSRPRSSGAPRSTTSSTW